MNKMAIDYKKEWENFKIYYKFRKVEAEEVGAGPTIGSLMGDWINAVKEIEEEEKIKE